MIKTVKTINSLDRYFLISAKHLNNIAFFVSIWAFFLPIPYRLVITLCILIFLSALFVFLYSRGTIPFEEPKKPKSINLTYAIMGPSLALAWRGFSDFNFVNAHDLLIPVLSVFLFLIILSYLKIRRFNLRMRTYLTAIPFLFAFSFGIVVETNGFFYSQDTIEYNARVINKEVSNSGDGPVLYYLIVTQWADRQDNNKLIVSKNTYNSFTINDDVSIRVIQGLLKIPYYYVLKKC